MRTLHELLVARRKEILDRWTARIRSSTGGLPVTSVELVDHVPRFLDELAEFLSRADSEAAATQRTSTAAKHGIQRFRIGFDLDAVVREYGTLHRVILEVAGEEGVLPTIDEEIVLVECMNTGIADAVTQYSAQRDAELHRQASEHFAFVAHELRNPLASAELALKLLRKKGPLPSNSLADIVSRGVGKTRELIENTLTVAMGGRTTNLAKQPFDVGEVITEAAGESALAAREKNITIRADQRAPIKFVGDRRLVSSAVTNLVNNAVKFTHEGGTIRVDWRTDKHYVLIDVADECGGLPEGAEEKMFKAFVQVGQDRTGYGLGLAIARQAVLAHGGSIRVQNRENHGCTLTIELPNPPASEAPKSPES